jgi:hypothetical protein
VQIHGGEGVRSGHPVENLYREIRALRIYEGASDVQKVVIARSVSLPWSTDMAPAKALRSLVPLRMSTRLRAYNLPRLTNGLLCCSIGPNSNIPNDLMQRLN